MFVNTGITFLEAVCIMVEIKRMVPALPSTEVTATNGINTFPSCSCWRLFSCVLCERCGSTA